MFKSEVTYKLSAPFDFGDDGLIEEVKFICPRGRDLKGLKLVLNIDAEAKTYNADYDMMIDAITRCISEPAYVKFMFMPDIVGAYQLLYENFMLPS